jgi:hypothetical protein
VISAQQNAGLALALAKWNRDRWQSLEGDLLIIGILLRSGQARQWWVSHRYLGADNATWRRSSASCPDPDATGQHFVHRFHPDLAQIWPPASWPAAMAVNRLPMAGPEPCRLMGADYGVTSRGKDSAYHLSRPSYYCCPRAACNWAETRCSPAPNPAACRAMMTPLLFLNDPSSLRRCSAI